MSIKFNLGKKLVLLVMLVTVVALGITSYMSTDYASETLKERGGELLIGESSIRGESLMSIFESRIEQNKILANDPMIQSLVLEMNEIPNDKLKESQENNRRNFLIQVQAFQELVGFSIGFEDTKIIGKNGIAFFSLSGNTNEDFTKDELFQRDTSGDINFISVYYLEYGDDGEDLQEIANLLLKRDKIEIAGLGNMNTFCLKTSKFTFPYSENIVVVEVSSEKSHQSVKKYCDQTRRDANRKGMSMANLLSLSILEQLK